MPRLGFPLFGLQIVAVLAFFVAAEAAEAQECLLKNAVSSITTMGSASAEVVPDIATISFGVVSERPTASDAANENAHAAGAMIAEIKAAGIEPADIKTIQVTLTPVYNETHDASGRMTGRTLHGYSARNDLRVRVRRIEKAGLLARQLIEKGANTFGGIEFDFEHKEEKYDVLRAEAVRDALRKANSYAAGLDLKLGRVLVIAPPGEGFSPIRPLSTQMSRAAQSDAIAALPIEPGVQILRVEVQVSWELAQ